MPFPTITSSTQTALDTTGTSKSISNISCSPGDRLLVYAIGGLSAGAQTPTVTGATFTLLSGSTSLNSGTIPLTASYITERLPNGLSSVTVTMTVTNASLIWGFGCLVVKDADGLPRTLGTNSSSVLGGSFIIGTQKSMGIMIGNDRNAGDGSSRVWRTIGGITPTSGNGYELAYVRNVGSNTSYVGYWPILGAPGSSLSGGLSSPSGGTYHFSMLTLSGNDSVVMSATVDFTNTYRRVASDGGSYLPTIGEHRPMLLVSVGVGVQPADGTDADVTTTVTVGERPMTSIAKIHSGGAAQGYVEYFYLLNPTLGSTSIVTVTASETVDLTFEAMGFNNVDQTNPFDVFTASGNSANPSITFTGTNPRSMLMTTLVSGLNIGSSAHSGSPSGVTDFSLTGNFSTASNAGCRAFNTMTNPSANQVIGWTITSSPWAMIGIRINPSSYAVPGTVFNLGM